MVRFRVFVAIAVGLLSSLAMPAAAVAHGHAHADAASHHSGVVLQESADAESASVTEHAADHAHASVGIGLKSFAPTIALPSQAAVTVPVVLVVRESPSAARTWHVAHSAESPPSATRAPPAVA